MLFGCLLTSTVFFLKFPACLGKYTTFAFRVICFLFFGVICWDAVGEPVMLRVCSCAIEICLLRLCLASNLVLW